MFGLCAGGKSALVKAFSEGRHVSQAYEPTVGLDFASKTVFLPDNRVGICVHDVCENLVRALSYFSHTRT